jgi:glucose-6-phosphate isomerase
MYKNKKYIFNSSGWQVNEDLLKKTNNILSSFRQKREAKEIPIFSIIDSDDDLEKIINDSTFFISNQLKDFILIGTGGSSLGADSFIQANKYNYLSQNINFHILDNLDPNSVAKIFNSIEPSTSKFLAVSKSGKTTETIALLLIVINWLITKKIKVEESIMVLCLENNNEFQELIEIAKEYNLKIVQHEKICGRFSALTSTGLLPATIMGLDPYSIRQAAREALNNVFDNNDNANYKTALQQLDVSNALVCF